MVIVTALWSELFCHTPVSGIALDQGHTARSRPKLLKWFISVNHNHDMGSAAHNENEDAVLSVETDCPFSLL